MPIRQLFETLPRPSLRLIVSEGDGSATGITYPGVARPADLTSVYQRMSEQNAADLPELDCNHDVIRETWTLWDFWDRSLSAWRRKQLAASRIRPGTLEKDLQSIRQWKRWDAMQQPDNWPGGRIWTGLPVGFLAPLYFEKFATDSLAAGYSVETQRARTCHLRTMVNWLTRLRVLHRSPLPNLGPTFDSWGQKSDEFCDIDDITPTAYSDDQLDAVYHRLASDIEHQTAWVLGANCGPRTEDLFTLRWEANIRLKADPASLFYTAGKTGKRHWCPLAPCIVEHLKRLAWSQRHLDAGSPGGLVFPRLTSDCKDPEGSRESRHRTARLKLILAELQMPCAETSDRYHKPYQVLRSTCNSRLNNHRPGAGLLITHGKDADVSSQHYWNERDKIVEAVMTLKQPASFLSILQ